MVTAKLNLAEKVFPAQERRFRWWGRRTTHGSDRVPEDTAPEPSRGTDYAQTRKRKVDGALHFLVRHPHRATASIRAQPILSGCVEVPREKPSCHSSCNGAVPAGRPQRVPILHALIAVRRLVLCQSRFFFFVFVHTVRGVPSCDARGQCTGKLTKGRK